MSNRESFELMPRLAFILLTHRNPPQIRRLIHALNVVYDKPPVVIHHDSHQCPLNDFPNHPNVTFVEPVRATAWADFTVVDATVDAMRILRDRSHEFDWFAVLSGADYPVRSGSDVRRELASQDCDACMLYEGILPTAIRRDWQQECVDRFFGFDVPVPRPTPHGFVIQQHRVSSPRLLRFFSPYSTRFRCYAGSQWFSARAHVAGIAVDQHEANPWLRRHLEHRVCPEETYFQTLLCNTSELKIRNDCFRYIDWSNQGAHPKSLGCEDIPRILESGAHFARKFDWDCPALDHFDRLLGIPPLVMEPPRFR